jgi:hypothetical protein
MGPALRPRKLVLNIAHDPTLQFLRSVTTDSKVLAMMTSTLSTNSVLSTLLTHHLREFFSTGYVNPLPPQEGIPGWKRLTMMKYFLTDDGAFDENALWAYEGVVLPGGQIIVGRWWSPELVPAEDMYSGPFILWNTDCQKLREARESKTNE